MLRFWEGLKNVLIDRSAQELIVALTIALALSLVVTGLYNLGRRKIHDGVMLMTGLVLMACIVSMLLAAGFLTRSRNVYLRSIERDAATRGMRVRPGPGIELPLARWIFDLADRDQDGSLSDEEAADAASRFIRMNSKDRKQPLDAEALAQVLRANLLPPFEPMPPGRVERPPMVNTQDRLRAPGSGRAR